jgi:hypothetical protein
MPLSVCVVVEKVRELAVVVAKPEPNVVVAELNLEKSEEERRPRIEAEAVGILKVKVPEEFVIPQSLLMAVVEVARVIAPVTAVPAECWRERRPAFVRAPEERESPVPVRSLNDSPFTIRFVVLAVTNEAYVVEERAKRLTPEKKFVSERSVEEAAVPRAVSM